MGPHHRGSYRGGGIFLGSGLKTVPRGKQIAAEYIVDWIYRYTRENMGKENEKFAPYIGSLFAFILCGSLLGLLGLRPGHGGSQRHLCPVGHDVYPDPVHGRT